MSKTTGSKKFVEDLASAITEAGKLAASKVTTSVSDEATAEGREWMLRNREVLKDTNVSAFNTAYTFNQGIPILAPSFWNSEKGENLVMVPGAYLMLAAAGSGKTTLLLELAIRAKASRVLDDESLHMLNKPSSAILHADGPVATNLTSRYDLWAHEPTRRLIETDARVAYFYINEARSRMKPTQIFGQPKWFVKEFELYLDKINPNVELVIFDSVNDAMQSYKMTERKDAAASKGGMYPQDRQFIADVNNVAASRGKIVVMALNTQLISFAEILKGASEGVMMPVPGEEGSMYINDRGLRNRETRKSYYVKMGPAHNAKDLQGVARITTHSGTTNMFSW